MAKKLFAAIPMLLIVWFSSAREQNRRLQTNGRVNQTNYLFLIDSTHFGPASAGFYSCISKMPDTSLPQRAGKGPHLRRPFWKNSDFWAPVIAFIMLLSPYLLSLLIPV